MASSAGGQCARLRASGGLEDHERLTLPGRDQGSYGHADPHRLRIHAFDATHHPRALLQVDECQAVGLFRGPWTNDGNGIDATATRHGLPLEVRRSARGLSHTRVKYPTSARAAALHHEASLGEKLPIFGVGPLAIHEQYSARDVLKFRRTMGWC